AADIAAAQWRSTLKVPIRFTRITVSKGWSWAGPLRVTTRSAQPIPAHDAAKRSPPNASTVAATAASTSASLVTSALKARALPPSSSTRALARSPSRSAIATRAPRRTSSRAVAAPRPEAPPATSAGVPSSFTGRDGIGWRLHRPGQRQPEHAVVVGEEGLELHPRTAKLGLKPLARELRRH